MIVGLWGEKTTIYQSTLNGKRPLTVYTIENGPLSSLIYPLKMVMFHSYVNVYQRVKGGNSPRKIWETDGKTRISPRKIWETDGKTRIPPRKIWEIDGTSRFFRVNGGVSPRKI